VEPRTFELEEANRALPEVRRLVSQIVELTQLLPELQDQMRIAEYRGSRPGAGAAEADGRERALSSLRAAEADLVDALQALEAMGVQLKDPRMGLVDFLAYRDGELVELCWRLGEDRVAYWHRIGEGYPGRKRL
jgi:hypothetical protein